MRRAGRARDDRGRPAPDRAADQSDEPEDVADRSDRRRRCRHLRPGSVDLGGAHSRVQSNHMVRQICVVQPHEHVEHLLGQNRHGQQK